MIVLWFLLGCLWLFAKVAIGAGILLLVAGTNWRIRSALARRRKCKAAERETWARSVVKETRPPPIDPDLAAYIAAKTPIRQKQAAAAVRRKLKRKNSK